MTGSSAGHSPDAAEGASGWGWSDIFMSVSHMFCTSLPLIHGGARQQGPHPLNQEALVKSDHVSMCVVTWQTKTLSGNRRQIQLSLLKFINMEAQMRSKQNSNSLTGTNSTKCA